MPSRHRIDLSLARFGDMRTVAARRAAELRYARMSRESLIRRHGQTPADPQAASMLADLDRRIARLEGR